MPINRYTHSDRRQRREWQRMNAGRDVESPLQRTPGSGDLTLALDDNSGLEVDGDGELTINPGDGLTLTANELLVALVTPGYLEFLTSEIQLKTQVVQREYMLYIEDPTDSDEFPIGYVRNPMTVGEIRGQTDAGTVTFNVEHRAQGSPFSTGTEIADGSDVVADNTGATQSGFNDATIPADRWLYFVASATSGTPTKLLVTIERTLDT